MSVQILLCIIAGLLLIVAMTAIAVLVWIRRIAVCLKGDDEICTMINARDVYKRNKERTRRVTV